MDNHAVRLPPNARRNMFNATSRRQNPTTIRPDHQISSTTIFQQPADEEYVERDAQGDFKIAAPHALYKSMALGLVEETDQETSQDNEMIALYEQRNSHWDPKMVEEEIKAALKNSLKKKVASVEEDRWMFEGETEVGKK